MFGSEIENIFVILCHRDVHSTYMYVNMYNGHLNHRYLDYMLQFVQYMHITVFIILKSTYKLTRKIMQCYEAFNADTLLHKGEIDFTFLPFIKLQ